MSRREILLPWVSQPQEAVRPAQRWINRGLIYADPLLYAVNTVDGKTDAVVGTKVAANTYGLARGFGSTFGVASTDLIETTLKTTPTEVTYVIKASINGYGGANLGRIFEKRVSGAGTTGLYVDAASGNKLVFYSGRSTTAGIWNVPVPASSVITLAVSYSSASNANVPIIYFDGVSQSVTTISAPVGTVTTDSDSYVIGNRKNDSARNFDGRLSDFSVFRSILSNAEIVDLSSNAWEIWEAQRIWVPVSAASGPPTLAAIAASNLTASGARLTVT